MLDCPYMTYQQPFYSSWSFRLWYVKLFFKPLPHFFLGENRLYIVSSQDRAAGPLAPSSQMSGKPGRPGTQGRKWPFQDSSCKEFSPPPHWPCSVSASAPRLPTLFVKAHHWGKETVPHPSDAKGNNVSQLSTSIPWPPAAGISSSCPANPGGLASGVPQMLGVNSLWKPMPTLLLV